MKLISARWLPLLFVTLLPIGAGPIRAADDPAARGTLNDGYSQFYNFCQQESQLSLLFYIKSAPADIADYARRISATAKDDAAILKKFSETDAALRLDKVSLPPFEQEVRKSMDADRQHLLLWGSSGAAFAQAVYMTQNEATNYGLHVAKILADTEPNPARARAMRRIFDKWTALHAESFRLDRAKE